VNVDVKSAVIIIYIYLVLLFIYTTFGYIVIFFYFVRTLSDQGQEKLFPRRRKASEEIGSTFL